jgi:hypothetical protein
VLVEKCIDLFYVAENLYHINLPTRRKLVTTFITYIYIAGHITVIIHYLNLRSRSCQPRKILLLTHPSENII